MNGAELLVGELVRHGVRYIFGVPGDTSIAWYDAMRTQPLVKHVLATDERNAGFMADAFARITNEPGVCEGPSGAGFTYMLPGICEANDNSIPLIALNTDIETFFRGRARLTELDQVSIAAPMTRWSASLDDVRQIPFSVRKAFRIALGPRPGAVHLALPSNVMDSAADGVTASVVRGAPFRLPTTRQRPSDEELEAAARAIEGSRKPVLVVGGGIHLSRGYDALREFAEHIAAPVATSISGKGAIAETHDLALGVVGENGGSEVASKAVAEADLVIFVGTHTGSVVTQKWTVPTQGKGQAIVQIDSNAEEVGRNYCLEVGLVGDARATLDALRARLPKRREMGERERQLRREVTEWRKQESDMQGDGSPSCHPMSIVGLLRDVAPEDALYVADAGTPCPYLAAYLESRTGRHVLIPRGHGGLGWAIPAVVGAHYGLEHIGEAGRKIVAVMGDGSMRMSMNELVTLVDNKINAVIVLMQNDEYGWCKTGEKAGGRSEHLGLDFPPRDYSAIAKAMGMAGESVSDTKSLGKALRKAMKEDGPSFVSVATTPMWKGQPPIIGWRKKLQAGRQSPAAGSCS